MNHLQNVGRWDKEMRIISGCTVAGRAPKAIDTLQLRPGLAASARKGMFIALPFVSPSRFSHPEVCADPPRFCRLDVREDAVAKMRARLSALLRDENGQDLIEYALIATLMVIAMIVVVGDAGTEVTRLWTGIASGIPDIP